MEYYDYLVPRYTFRQAALAAAFPVNTLRSNYQRGWFRSFANGLSKGRGRSQLLCLGDILVLAIASRLIDMGMRPLDAFNVAQPFGLAARTPAGHEPRKPFQLFDRAKYRTVLIWRKDAVHRVVPVENDAGVPSELFDDDAFGVATLVLPLNPVESTVCRRLGVSMPEGQNV